MFNLRGSIRTIGCLFAACMLVARADAGELRPGSPGTSLSLEEFSPSMLGVYRKVMNIEDDIVRYSGQYGLDASLARAVCMYESGGNANLTSSAGAHGYFQVMPATMRLMRVKGNNIEAGVKYLASLVKRFGREDYALAAYNGGPGRVAGGRPMPIESLQYVIGVGTYRSVLKAYEPAIRAYAEQLKVTRAGNSDWWQLSQRLHLPVVQLRLHNPFLANRALRPGDTVAYPAEPRDDIFASPDRSRYRLRLGDNYITLAFALGVDVSALRNLNKLWPLHATLPGTELVIPSNSTGAFTEYTVRANDTLGAVAARLKVEPWSIIRDNHLWDDELHEATVIHIRARPVPPPFRIHRVKRGDTLTSIARRYGTTIRALRAANGIDDRRALVKTGQRLRIPTS